jgi:hypothetical protein
MNKVAGLRLRRQRMHMSRPQLHFCRVSGEFPVTEDQMNAQSMLGMFHAQELLLISLIRALPLETRRRIADEFQEQVELAEAPHLSAGHEHETTEVFKAHIRKLSILLASLS